MEQADGYGWTAAYAESPKQVYAVSFVYTNDLREYSLYTADIASHDQVKHIDLPREYKGEKLSNMKICGISPRGLYVFFSVYDWWYNPVGVVYLVPHNGGKDEIIAAGGGFASPWYNAEGNSLLYFRRDEPEAPWRLEAMRLDTGKRSVVFNDGIRPNGTSDVWHNLRDGSVALERFDDDSHEGPCLRFDADNKAQEREYTHNDLNYAWVKPPLNDKYRAYTTCGGWLYYVVEGESWNRHFYRMKPDGT